MTQLKKGSLHGEKQNRRSGINAKLHSDECGRGFSIHTVRLAEFGHAVDDEFLHQIRTERDAGDERCAGNRNATQWQARAEDADQQRGHARRDQRELPDATSEIDAIAFSKPQRIDDQRQSRQPEPNRQVC